MSNDNNRGQEGLIVRAEIEELDRELDRLEQAQRESVQTGLRYSSIGQASLKIQQENRDKRILATLAQRSALVEKLGKLV